MPAALIGCQGMLEPRISLHSRMLVKAKPPHACNMYNTLALQLCIAAA